MKTITVADIARKAGVSAATVSRALNNRPKVAPELRKQIIELAREMGYESSGVSRNRTIAVILPAKENFGIGSYSQALLGRIVQHESLMRGYRVMLVPADDFAIIEEQMIAGILSFDFINHLSHTLPRLKNIPLVCINDYSMRFENVHSVCSNDRQGIRLALDHLLGLGHRRIGLLLNIEGGANLCSEAREQCFRERMAEAGPADFAPVRRVTAVTTRFEAIGQLLKQGVTALVAPGEDVPLWLYYYLDLCGKRIPEDVSVVTWEAPELSKLLMPRTTAVGQNFTRIVEIAFDMLERQIAGFPVSDDVVVDYDLFVRESTAPPGASPTG